MQRIGTFSFFARLTHSARVSGFAFVLSDRARHYNFANIGQCYKYRKMEHTDGHRLPFTKIFVCNLQALRSLIQSAKGSRVVSLARMTCVPISGYLD